MNSHRRILSVLVATALSLVSIQRAEAGVTYSDIVNTADQWSFNFSGDGLGLIGAGAGAPVPVGWSAPFEVVSEVPTSFQWHLELSHLGGPDLTVDLGGAYGTTQTGFMTLPHGSGWDTLQLSLTVQPEPIPGANASTWGKFSGSVQAIHRGESVPDAATTAGLLALGFGVLGLVRRYLRS